MKIKYSHDRASYLDIFPSSEGLLDVHGITSRSCRFEICSHHNALGLVDVTGRVTINIATIGWSAAGEGSSASGETKTPEVNSTA